MTVAEMHEIVTLAEEAQEAAEAAGAVSRVRSVDIQLTTVREKTAALVQKARELTAEES